jgi:hypothetical protein
MITNQTSYQHLVIIQLDFQMFWNETGRQESFPAEW